MALSLEESVGTAVEDEAAEACKAPPAFGAGAEDFAPSPFAAETASAASPGDSRHFKAAEGCWPRSRSPRPEKLEVEEVEEAIENEMVAAVAELERRWRSYLSYLSGYMGVQLRSLRCQSLSFKNSLAGQDIALLSLALKSIHSRGGTAGVAKALAVSPRPPAWESWLIEAAEAPVDPYPIA
ncbi:hypothetical protein AK812_SmicGene19944 [Symbiodinium microadriaticum]|uniref:Uncharacterized protein n=1 Tax=Symbiodinium microadriaticum TaxID=2951 RepID=A0A1Q9DR81_SYMMI|nr:hypothetical protein AK812_SmicGene19944 [Symbiodinium microadriaticum]